MDDPVKSIRLLLVEDSENDARLLIRRLRQAEFEPQALRVDDPESLRQALASSPWDVVICDYQMPAMDAPRAVSIIRATGLDVPIIVVSGTVGEESAVAVMRAGAQDYLMKDRLFRLGEVIRRELAEVAIRRQRAEAEEAFLASEDRLRFALEAAGMGVWDWDIRADEMHWASPAQKWTATADRQQGTFAECLEVVYPDDRDMVARAYADAVEGRRQQYAMENRVQAEDGAVHWIDVRGRVVFDGAGQAVRMAGTFLDITQRHALEEQLAHSDKMKTIGQLAGGVAHDFNNLLTVILTYCQLLDGLDPGNGEVTELTSPVRDAAERAAALTRQLLVFSRPEAAAPRVLDLNEVIQTVTKLLNRLVGEQVLIETHLAPDLWRVRMDRTQCEQVILNLAVNARDAMPRGGTVRITTRNVPAGSPDEPITSDRDRLLLEVSDTGDGMTDEVQRKAFQPFFTTKSLGRGTGLGLATCQTAVRNADGAIHLQSAPGKGTTFRIYLPRSEEEVEPVVRAELGTRPGTAIEAILVVEDDALVRVSATRALRAAGYTVVAASDGEEAYRLLAAQPDKFKLIFTDMVMPRMGGQDLADVVRIRMPGIPILFASGYPPDVPGGDGRPVGAPFLAKPYSADELTRRVRALLDERRRQKPPV